MNHKREHGVSIVNTILIILIIIALIIIYFLITVDDTKKVSITNNVITNYIPGISTNQNTEQPSQPTQNITLSNSILDPHPGSPNENQTPTPSPDNNQYTHYFYNQLGDKEKAMYTQIINNVDSFKRGNERIAIGSSTDESDADFQSCWDAFSMDRPEVFYVDTQKVSLVTSSSSSFLGPTKYEFYLQPQDGRSYYLNCWSTEEQVQNAINQVEGVANSIISMTSNYTSRYDKVKFIHDYLIENADYDRDEDINNSDIYGMLVKNKAVCEGYAKAFKYILDKIGIPCVVVCGDGQSDDGHTEFHAWDYVLMEDNNWYAVDATWDDPIVIGNGKLSEQTKHRYFLVGSNSFFAGHKEDGDVSGTGQSFKYPQISTTDYKK
ncbi:MAG: hypothetical protein IKG56_01215 [Clostridia bacterium]|nr:hypothetical protein [Clostridia bacterium]